MSKSQKSTRKIKEGMTQKRSSFEIFNEIQYVPTYF